MSALVVVFLLFDTIIHLTKPAPVVDAFAKLGFPSVPRLELESWKSAFSSGAASGCGTSGCVRWFRCAVRTEIRLS